MGDWLGTGNVAYFLRHYRPFEEGRAFARSLNLGCLSEWDQFCRGNLPEKGTLPPDIPAKPSNTYAKKGWAGVGDWLGTGNIASQMRNYLPFEEARAFARDLGLKRGGEWRDFCKGNLPEKGTLPLDIPAKPQRTYANSGWRGMGDWLGTGNVATFCRHYRSFKKARDFARSLGLKTRGEWMQFCKGNLPEKGTLPPDIPAMPHKTYADKGWAGVGDWLGTGNVAPGQRRFRSFEDARAFARGLGLKTGSDWGEFCKGNMPDKGTLPADIPANPSRTYADKGWVGMGDWLGTGTVATRQREMRPFKQARSFVRGLGLKGQAEWRNYCKDNMPGKGTRPSDIPALPHKTYRKEGWAGYGDWLGTGNVAPQMRNHRPFEEARTFARGLGLKRRAEWRESCKGNLPEKGTLPSDIPAAPQQVYSDKGWGGVGDWLGTEKPRAPKSKRRD